MTKVELSEVLAQHGGCSHLAQRPHLGPAACRPRRRHGAGMAASGPQNGSSEVRR